MAIFKYKVRDRFSRPISGTLIAESKDDTASKLKDMGYIPILIEQTYELGKMGFLERFKRVKLEELNSFTRQLYALQKAGLTLLSSLTAIAEETKSVYFRNAIEEMARDIKGGVSFSDSLKKHGRIFGDIYISMIRASEIGGNITGALERLSTLIEREIDVRNQIKTATRYPVLAFIVLCLGFLILVTFVIPRFAGIYGQANVALPLPTQILMAISVGMRKYWYLLIFFMVLGIVVFIQFIRSSFGRPLWDNFKLNIPLIGQLVKMLTISRFARVTSILMKSGVPILEVMDLAAVTSGNVIIARAIKNIKESVNQGKGIAGPMKVSGLFPPVVIQMVSAGEQTGSIDELLMAVADYFDRETGYMIKNVTTYIEPALIFVLAIMVMVMALGIFLPMWNLIRVFRPG